MTAASDKLREAALASRAQTQRAAEEAAGVAPPLGDTASAVEFCKRYTHDTGAVFLTLSSCVTDPVTGKKGAFTTRAFTQPINWNDVADYADARQGKENLYFAVNPSRTPMGKKSEKKDVARVVAFHVDVDVRVGEEQVAGTERIIKSLEDYTPPPSLIISSGGGAQAFWLLEEPIEINGDLAKAGDAERFNRQLERDLQGDNCFNADRIMRLPGTINIPTEVKRRKGRKPALAYVHSYTGTKYPLAMFKKAEAASKPEEKAAGADPRAYLGKYERMDPNDPRLAALAPEWRIIGLKGDQENRYGGDRSRTLFAWACQCARAGIADDVIASCIMDPDWKIGECVRDKKNVKRDLDRTIERAHDGAADADLAAMNEKHCVISDIGGKCVVLNETADPATGDAKVTFSSFDAISNRYGNRWKKWMDGDEEKKRPLAEWWYHHPKRRQLETVAFTPGRNVSNVYNLYQGFAVAPDSVDSARKCSLYLAHVRENICQGDDTLYNYIIKWLARGVQFPGEPGGVALALRGKMGTGKGQFARHYGSLFGPHFIPVTKAEHIAGRFNGHMGECIFLFADECFYAGNPQHEQILKVLVTETMWLIERKNIDALRVNSCLHIILACNEEWSVPVSADDRRFCCIEVGERRIRDRAYFTAIADQMNAGGRSALLGYLLGIDLTAFNPEDFPRTDEHAHQRAMTRHGVDSLVEEMLHEGRVMFSIKDKPSVCITSGESEGKGFDNFIRTKAAMDLRRLGPGKVKNALKRIWGTSHFYGRINGRLVCGSDFPELLEMRKAFEERMGKTEWRNATATVWEANDDGIPF